MIALSVTKTGMLAFECHANPSGVATLAAFRDVTESAGSQCGCSRCRPPSLLLLSVRTCERREVRVRDCTVSTAIAVSRSASSALAQVECSPGRAGAAAWIHLLLFVVAPLLLIGGVSATYNPGNLNTPQNTSYCRPEKGI